jgi:hypothetical protein
MFLFAHYFFLTPVTLNIASPIRLNHAIYYSTQCLLRKLYKMRHTPGYSSVKKHLLGSVSKTQLRKRSYRQLN